MISLGLSSADQKLYEQALISGYNLKITVQILDLQHRYITDVSSMLIDGQVNYSYRELIGSSASMTLLDPDSLTGFDTSSPSDNALYADRMIRIVYCVWVDTTTVSYSGSDTYSDSYSDSYTSGTGSLPTGFWVDVPIFCGPVTKVNRDDAILSVECQGKEALVSEPNLAWTARTWKRGTRGVTALRELMTTKAGETKFDFPEYSFTLGRDYVLWGASVIWPFAKSLASARHGRHLFYDGRGVLRLRELTGRPVWTFTESTLLSVPQLDYNHAEIRNGVRVIGSPTTLRAYRYLPTSHPSSPTSLGRNGVKRYLIELVEDSSLTTQAAVNEAANNTLDNLADAHVGFQFDSFPIPHLEPGDMFHLSTREFSIQLRLGEFSIPLKAGQPQSNGVIKKISANRARLRRR